MKRAYGFVFVLALGIMIPTGVIAQETDIETAKDVFPKMTEAIHLFADRVDSLSTPEEFIQATTEYARTVEEFGKEEVRLLKENQEWFDDMPAELSDIFTEYREAMSRYDPAVQAVTRRCSAW